jgi:hypothetical protein
LRKSSITDPRVTRRESDFVPRGQQGGTKVIVDGNFRRQPFGRAGAGAVFTPTGREFSMCVICHVEEAMKDKIIAYGAEFHKVTKSPYGKDGEIGMLHLIDAKSRAAILSRADASKVFDLSVDNFIGMPGWLGAGDQPYQIWMTHTPNGEIVSNSMKTSLEANTLVSYSGDAISMYTHCGTHIDPLNHFGYNGKIFNEFSAADHLGGRSWDRCGAEKHPPIFARGVLLDIAALYGR